MRQAFLLVWLIAASASSLCAQEWSLSETPLFQVGGLSDDLDYALTEVVGAVRLDDGRVAIADRMWYGVKLYSPDGQLLRSVGGEGQGPGEYEHIRGMGRCAKGRLVAHDLHWDQVHYSLELELIETRPAQVDALGGTPYQAACNESGYVLASGWGDPMAHFTVGYFSTTAPVVLLQGGELKHVFGERLSSERIGVLRNTGEPGGSGPHPFGRQTSVALSEMYAFLGDAGEYRVEVYDLDGTRRPDIVWTGPDLTVRDGDLQLLADRAVQEAAPSSQARVRRFYSRMPPLERYPAYDRLMTDREGNLWVRYFRRPSAPMVEWVVFDPEGGRLGELQLSPRASLLEAGADYVVVAEHDDFDVPTLAVYRLLKT